MRKNLSEPHRHTAQCRELFAHLSEYLDKELDEGARKRIEAHLHDCSACRVCLSTLERTIALCGALPSPPMDDAVTRRLRDMLAGLLISPEP